MRFTDAYTHLRWYVKSFNLPVAAQPPTTLPSLYYLRGKRMKPVGR